MKVIKKGIKKNNSPKKFICTGRGNGGKGCEATLLVEEKDYFSTYSCFLSGEEIYHKSFMCCECGTKTNVDDNGRNFIKMADWIKDNPNHMVVSDEKVKLEVVYSDDYIGLDVGGWKFYYGYEKWVCPHGINEKSEKDCKCHEENSCFTAENNGKEIVRYTSLELEANGMRQNDVQAYILMGLGKMIAEKKL